MLGRLCVLSIQIEHSSIPHLHSSPPFLTLPLPMSQPSFEIDWYRARAEQERNKQTVQMARAAKREAAKIEASLAEQVKGSMVKQVVCACSMCALAVPIESETVKRVRRV